MQTKHSLIGYSLNCLYVKEPYVSIWFIYSRTIKVDTLTYSYSIALIALILHKFPLVLQLADSR